MRRTPPDRLAEPDDDHTDRLLRALADGTRRQLLDRLRDHPGLTLGELAMGFAHSRQALSKHLATLEAADLVVTLWRGREKLHYLNPQPLRALPARWVTHDDQQDRAALQALQAATTPAPGETRPADGPGPGLLPEATSAGSPGATVLTALLQAPGPLLAGGRITDMAALQAARRYLAGTAEAVRQLLAALTDEVARQPTPAGGFSLGQHLWHLADLEEEAWVPRWHRLLTETRPRLPGFDGDRIARERDYASRPWRGAGRRFIAQRRRALALLARCSPAELALPALFAGRRSSGGDLLAAMVAHDLEHRLEMAERWTAAQPKGPT